MKTSALLRLIPTLALSIATFAIAPLAATGQSGPPSSVRGPQAPGSLFLPSNVSGATNGGSIAIDAAGTVHVVFEVYISGPIMYAECASNCTSAASWTNVQVGSNGALGSRPLLRLSPSGQPRLMYIHEAPSSSPPTALVYNECNANCTVAANWTEIPVVNVSTYGRSSPGTNFFALDSQGRPRAAFSNPGEQMFYISCDSGCAVSDANWQVTTLTGLLGINPALSIDSADHPHLVYTRNDSGVSADNDVLLYATCGGTCTNAANWAATGTFLVGKSYQASYSIDVDGGNHPRIAFYSANLVVTDTNQINKLIYVWCDAACTTPAGWGAAYVGTAAGDGVKPDLVIDASDHPHVSYINSESGYEIGYATCQASCESNSGDWVGGHLERPLDYPALTPNPGCISPFWYTTYPTSLALDAGGSPHIVFGAYNLQNCSGTIGEKLRLVRYLELDIRTSPTATPAGSSTPQPSATPPVQPTVDTSTLTHKTFMPLLRK